jgi:hypothetical protein
MTRSCDEIQSEIKHIQQEIAEGIFSRAVLLEKLQLELEEANNASLSIEAEIREIQPVVASSKLGKAPEIPDLQENLAASSLAGGCGGVKTVMVKDDQASKECMTEFWEHCRLLLWKNRLLKARRPISALLEILLPVAFVFVFVYFDDQAGEQRFAQQSFIGTSTDQPCVCDNQGTYLWPTNINCRFCPPSWTGPDGCRGDTPEGCAFDEVCACDNRCVKNKRIGFCQADGGVLGSGAGALGVQAKWVKHIMPMTALISILQSSASWTRRAGFRGHIALAPREPALRFQAWMTEQYPKIRIQGPNPGGGTVTYLDINAFDDPIISQVYDTENEIESFVTSDTYGRGGARGEIFAAIVFSSVPSEASGSFVSGAMNYKIRMNGTVIYQRTPSTAAPVVTQFYTGMDVSDMTNYATEGFMTLQQAVDKYTINAGLDLSAATTESTRAELMLGAGYSPGLVTELAKAAAPAPGPTLTCQCERSSATAPGAGTCARNDCEGVFSQLASPLAFAPQSVRVAPFPSPSFVRSPFYDIVKNVLGLFFVAIFAKSLAVLLGDMITEKETGIREMLSLMGMNREAHMASW